jgi:hypothetical protein
MVQENSNTNSRAVLGSEFDVGTVDFTLPTVVANRGLKWNASGTGLENTDGDPDDAAVYAGAAQVYASAAEAAKNDAEAAQAAAEAAAAIMPDPTGKGLQIFRANSGGTANEYSGVTISTDGTFAANSDAKVPTEKAVKTYVGSMAGFGAWVDRSAGYANIQASTDIILVISAGASSQGNVAVYSDGNATPSTQRAAAYAYGNNDGVCCTCPIRKGDYWRVEKSAGISSLLVMELPIGA